MGAGNFNSIPDEFEDDPLQDIGPDRNLMGLPDSSGAYLGMDDVLIATSISDTALPDIKIDIDFLGTELGIPLALAITPDLSTGRGIADMQRVGGMGIMHRMYSSDDAYEADLDLLRATLKPVWISVDISDIPRSMRLINKVSEKAEVAGVVIDTAHGHHKSVRDLVERIKGSVTEDISRLRVVAGNIFDYDAALYLAESGVDGLKVGCGHGKTFDYAEDLGIGLPHISALLECASLRTDFPELQIISDQPIRNNADIAKCIAAGADIVMIGSDFIGNRTLDQVVNRVSDTLRTTMYFAGIESIRDFRDGARFLVVSKPKSA